ncbi:hypothetical protein ACF3NL_06870 [Dolosigranulum pigrum]|uniref:hypothetical protein n=1 Tax=Dolosigranulum pigrum TaxID=29394 RepID=UPI00191B41F6|nr:hypothetical protein [Dolosigranulum pigrum]
MNLHGTDLSEEKQELEEAIRQLGFVPNHNYFRTARGIHPLLNIFIRTKSFYYLVFTDDYLIMMWLDYPFDNNIGDHYVQIPHKDLSNFSVEQVIRGYYIYFVYNKESYYLYIDDDPLIRRTPNYSGRNFRWLKEENFKGLLD